MKSVITFSHLLQKEGGTGVNPKTEIAGKKFENNMITIKSHDNR